MSNIVQSIQQMNYNVNENLARHNCSLREPVANDTRFLLDQYFQKLYDRGEVWDREKSSIQQGEKVPVTWCRVMKLDEPIMVKDGPAYLVVGFGIQFVKWEGETEYFKVISKKENLIAGEALVFTMTEGKRSCEKRRLDESKSTPKNGPFWDALFTSLNNLGYNRLGDRRFSHLKLFTATTIYDESVIEILTKFNKVKYDKTNNVKREKKKAEQNISVSIAADASENSTPGIGSNATTLAGRPEEVPLVEPENYRTPMVRPLNKRTWPEAFEGLINQASPQEEMDCLQFLAQRLATRSGWRGYCILENIDEPIDVNPPLDDGALVPLNETGVVIPPSHPRRILLETRTNVSEQQDETTNRSHVNDVSNPVEHSTAVRNDDLNDGVGGISVDNIPNATAPGANADSSNIVNSESPDEEKEEIDLMINGMVKSSKARNGMSSDEELRRILRSDE